MWDWMAKAAELKQQGRPFVLATIVRTQGSGPRKAGTKMVVTAEGRYAGTVGGGALEEVLTADCREALREGQSDWASYSLCARAGQCCGGTVEVFMDVIKPEAPVLLFGAGHVGQELAGVLMDTGFQVHVMDERSEWIDAEGLPDRVIRHRGSPLDALDGLPWDRHSTCVVIMTHSHDLDLELLRAVLERPARYVGLIGSRTKWELFQKKLLAAGISPDMLQRVDCPIGLDIGGNAPKEIAISVAAGLLKNRYEK